MHSLDQLRSRENNIELLAGSPTGLHAILTELQGLKFAVANGANADTNIAVSGITTSDSLVTVLEFTKSTGNLTGINDKKATCSITSAGNIQCTDSTSGSVLLIVWYDQS